MTHGMDVRGEARQTVSTQKQKIKTVHPKCARQHGELKQKITVDAGGARFIVFALRDPYLNNERRHGRSSIPYRVLSLEWSNHK